MAARPVEWVMVVRYVLANHKATYGRIPGPGYTKDYLQLSRKREFVEEVARILSVPPSETGNVPLTYRWPKGSARGDFVFRSADRPHLKWETRDGAPPPWRMAASPSSATVQTIPGNPDHENYEDADNEFASIESKGAGTPFLIAVKLAGESRAFHLRAYLADASDEYAWASINFVPEEVRALASATTDRSATRWSLIESRGTAPTRQVEDAIARLSLAEDPIAIIGGFDAVTAQSLLGHLRSPGVGLFFDPSKNHDAWLRPTMLPMSVATRVDDLIRELEARYPTLSPGDAAAEELAVDLIEVEEFREQIEQADYSVADAMVTTKSRGSAQRAFADAVKANYGHACAITGVHTRAFLVASHIVPWSVDQSIRLDPSNGICLSLMVDRAFEKGYLVIDDDLAVRIDAQRVGEDVELLRHLQPLEGRIVRAPERHAPRIEYLRRRRTLVAND